MVLGGVLLLSFQEFGKYEYELNIKRKHLSVLTETYGNKGVDEMFSMYGVNQKANRRLKRSTMDGQIDDRRKVDRQKKEVAPIGMKGGINSRGIDGEVKINSGKQRKVEKYESKGNY